jgi:sucrose phosphorylase
MTFTWEKDGYAATLKADLADMTFEIRGTSAEGEIVIK